MCWLSSEQCYVEPRLLCHYCTLTKVVKTTHKMFLRAYISTKANLTTWKLEKEGRQCEKSIHLIRINAKQKKNLREAGWSHNILFDCKWKKTHNKEKNYRSKAPDKQHQKTMPQIARYSNPLKQCKESHADRKNAMLNLQIIINMQSSLPSIRQTPFN